MGEVRGNAAASASIPTKYATYVINNSEDKKGFTSKSGGNTFFTLAFKISTFQMEHVLKKNSLRFQLQIHSICSSRINCKSQNI